MAAYNVILHPQAWGTLSSISGARRRQLLAVLEQLATDPFRSGALQQRDQAGRINEVALLGDWLVTFWVDHAAREIRVVVLESPED